MGPIYDELGLEQGGPSSSEFYQIYKNEQLSSAQRSGLGTGIAGITLASVGLADDTALASNDLHQLQMLLDISLLYCQKHQVQLSASKKKLLVFSMEESTYLCQEYKADISSSYGQRYWANSLASLRAETIFCTPVLYSGMATLLLTKPESNILSFHVKDMISKLLKLHPKTPSPVVFFLAGNFQVRPSCM